MSYTYNLENAEDTCVDEEYIDLTSEIVDFEPLLMAVKLENAGIIFAKVRDELGISQSGAAKRLKKQQPQLSAWEKGSGNIKLEQIFEIAVVLQVNPIALILKMYCEGIADRVAQDLPIAFYEGLANRTLRDVYNNSKEKQDEEARKQDVWAKRNLESVLA